MEWRLAGQQHSFVLQFKNDGEFVLPDTDSVVVTVRGSDGAPLSGLVLSSVNSTQALVITPVEQNTLADDKLFETRYIRLDFRVFDQPFFVTQAYRIHRFLPLTVDGDSVRALVAAQFEELPDAAIDLPAAYFTLLDSFGSEFAGALTRSDIGALAANSAVALQAAIDVCPSMPARLLKMEKSDTSQYQRNDIDFEKLEADLRSKLADALSKITAVVGGSVSSVTAPAFFVVTKQTDRITNEAS